MDLEQHPSLYADIADKNLRYLAAQQDGAAAQRMYMEQFRVISAGSPKSWVSSFEVLCASVLLQVSRCYTGAGRDHIRIPAVE